MVVPELQSLADDRRDRLLLMFPVMLYPLVVEGGIPDVLEYGFVLLWDVDSD
jgi:hypothetical protein